MTAHAPAPPDGPLLTVDEVAGLLRLSATTVYRLVEARRIPHLRVSRSLRFLRGEVLAWARDGLGAREPGL